MVGYLNIYDWTIVKINFYFAELLKFACIHKTTMFEETAPSHTEILAVEKRMLSELNIPETWLDAHINGHIVKIYNLKNESVANLTDDSIYILLIKETVKTTENSLLYPDHVLLVYTNHMF